MDVCSAPTGVERRNEVCEAGSPLALDNGEFTHYFEEKALLVGDKKAMNAYMNRVALGTFSYFDVGNRPSDEAPKRFYHGFVLGLIVDLQGKKVLIDGE